jgi:hypothetical protein
VAMSDATDFKAALATLAQAQGRKAARDAI